MDVPVVMPRLGDTMADGTVNTWYKKVGEQINEGEPLLEIGTDKIDTEVESPASGVLVSILVPEDETVEVGTPLAIIRSDG